MKLLPLLIPAICLFSFKVSANELQASDARIKSVKISGYLGKRIDDCINNRVKKQDIDELIEPFRHRDERTRWQTEFWGKWILGAIGSYRYTGDPALYDMIVRSAEGIMATQSSDGYIGNYAPDAQLEQWDVWGRKYTLLGLLSWYDLSGDKKALKSACRLADHLISQVGPGKTSIVSTGNYRGMASCSILEPIMYLFLRTGDQRYLDFAKYIASELESSQGPQLVAKALNHIPVSQRFPHPASWFSRENGQKAYEMMSCYEGLLELFKVTGERNYFIAAQDAAQDIINTEINIAGSGSAFECWYGGRNLQYLPTYHTMETCVTFTWMQFCHRLLNLTGNVEFIDQIERSMYNALLAAMKDDASQIAKYSPLEGCRTEGEEQCGMHINCCNANGPRAFAMIPQLIYQAAPNNIRINLYAESEAEITQGKQTVRIRQETSYPKEGKTEIIVTPSRSSEFTISLRIPEWSKTNSIQINGQQISETIKPGSYHNITRKWQPGDRITVSFDMRARLIEMPNVQAILRGPIVLARDSRFGDGDVDQSSVIVSRDGYVDLQPIEDNGFYWMGFTAPMVMGTDLEGDRTPKQIRLCDFASAGNSWDKKCRYRVWLPKTLNVTKGEYRPY